MRRFFVVLSVMLVACTTGDSTSPASLSPAGVYQLKTVNGSSLPFAVYQSDTLTSVMTSDVLTVADSGTWSEVTAYSVTDHGHLTNQSFGDAGKWSRAGADFSFYIVNNSGVGYGLPDNSLQYSGTFTEPSFVLTHTTSSYLFSK